MQPGKHLKISLRVGTDCSGIEAPLQALKSLDVDFKPCFCSDIDERLVRFSKRNFHTWKSYDNVRHRDNHCSTVPSVDIYGAGFPCQAYSSAGRRGGSSDPRGKILPGILDYITNKKPKIFFLENVVGFTTINKGKDCSKLVSYLQKLDYHIYNKIINT